MNACFPSIESMKRSLEKMETSQGEKKLDNGKHGKKPRFENRQPRAIPRGTESHRDTETYHGRSNHGAMSSRGRGRGAARGHHRPYQQRPFGSRQIHKHASRNDPRSHNGAKVAKVPDMSKLNSTITNIILADVTEGFQFYNYSVSFLDAEGKTVDSRHWRNTLFEQLFWNGFLKSLPQKEKDDLRRVVFFSGFFFFSGRAIPGIEPRKLPLILTGNQEVEGCSMHLLKCDHFLRPAELQAGPTSAQSDEVVFDRRCSDCTRSFSDTHSLLQHCRQTKHKPVYVCQKDGSSKESFPRPAKIEVFQSFVNQILHRALGERLTRWGGEFIDPSTVSEPRDSRGGSLGVRVYEAFSCQFGLVRSRKGGAKLGLTVDLCSKIVRTSSLLDNLYGTKDPRLHTLETVEEQRARKRWIGKTIISMHDKRCYSIVDFVFEQSPSSMMIQGLEISHCEYFEKRRGIQLEFPHVKPMVAVLGRRNQKIFLPVELVSSNDLDRGVKEKLPMISSFKPAARNAAIEKIRAYLVPGSQKTKRQSGLLPALGIQLHDGRLSANAHVLPVPRILAAGVDVPEFRRENWAPMLNRADFHVDPNRANILSVVLVYHASIESCIHSVYRKIMEKVNNLNTTYRFSERPSYLVRAGDGESHWRAVHKFFSDPTISRRNIFVLDFTKPRGVSDTAYPVIKQLLTRNGYLSQFVNFNTYPHDRPRDEKRSRMILQSISRQILQKTGARLWWVQIPKSLPTPAIFVGIDVFHAPHVYNIEKGKRVANNSCAAIIVQVHRSTAPGKAHIELYSEAVERMPGKEFDLDKALNNTLRRAQKELNVSPRACIVWRDGIGESAFDRAAKAEIQSIGAALAKPGPSGSSTVPLSYIVCQKRINTKFLSKDISGEPDGKYGVPSGTMVSDIQGLNYETFYINGRAPLCSTPKPVRYVVLRRDEELSGVQLEEITWNLCHDYPNWSGPIKVPSVLQMAHKLAELGGSLGDCGKSMDAKLLKNTLHFL